MSVGRNKYLSRISNAEDIRFNQKECRFEEFGPQCNQSSVSVNRTTMATFSFIITLQAALTKRIRHIHKDLEPYKWTTLQNMNSALHDMNPPAYCYFHINIIRQFDKYHCWDKSINR
ncbi:Hypothetical predicted protein [Octopus vulgaris]|uniref:Uncharacterized protein n=1 Tax=Octopus vulgaris TaxID=6645 RepID=A0AA36EYZ2_OCTVU|nr:Hypothetical predicted protein [Octopus vulgaris]